MSWFKYTPLVAGILNILTVVACYILACAYHYDSREWVLEVISLGKDDPERTVFTYHHYNFIIISLK